MPILKQKYIIAIITLSLTVLLFLIYYSTTPDNHNQQFIKFIEPANISKLFDLDLRYIIDNSKLCQNNSSRIQALILVTSYFGNVETRSAMRRAFPGKRLEEMGFRRLFLLGISPKDKYTTQKSVENENRRFDDILQGNFVEAYRNLTYKHGMGLKWAAENCFQAKFIIKMDDDIVVNFQKLPSLLQNLNVPDENRFIAGYVLRNMVPIREPYNKWYVTIEEYEGSKYPPFVSGWMYVTTPKTCLDLVKLMSSGVKYFWIDDTLITGILAEKLRVQHKDLREYFAVHSEFIDCCLNDMKTKKLDCDIIVGPNGGNNNLFYDFNVAMRKCDVEVCKKRTSPLNQTCVAERQVNLGRGDAVVETYKLK